ncbi:Sugar phosphate permease [Enhydrobacter aerosaccus]|uniref:Sugar phosphate permease n=1 Tax=Enhydrobacter aerosaccus TaxID=225324 RepID=A0A1T4KKF9_9HYPH|nr:MFS transporter [Enhydrobacter aerosaccus]SJZ42876.1 Sugar phosphate permease [Enhydrobacter aerosaccus]
MSAAVAVPARRDVRVISLIGVAHGASHYYQLAFVTMLLIVRDEVGLSFGEVGLLGSLFYAVSGFGQTAAGFAVDRFGARPILAGGLAALGLMLGLISIAHSFAAFAAIAIIGGLGNCVFHPADFAILNASVDQKRLGRAFSIHGLGGSLGWAAGPAMYFLDHSIGWVGAALIGAIPGLVLAFLVLVHRTDLVDHRIKARAAAGAHGGGSIRALFLQMPILLCLVYFALLATNTVGIQQFAVPAWKSMFDVTENYAAFCLMVFVVGSAAGMLAGGYFADRVHRHERTAAIGLLAAAALTLPIATQTVPPALLPVILALAGFAGGTTGPSRDMIVRQATPAGASGKVFGFVYSGLDLGSFLAPLVFGQLMSLGQPATMFWIATGLYVFNAGLVTIIRQASPPARVPAAAAE